MEVCKEMQKLNDIDNNTLAEYQEGIDVDDLVSWDDGVLAETDESIKKSIENHNAIIDHFEKCEHKGCKEMMENWKPYERYTDRNSMLNGREPQI